MLNNQEIEQLEKMAEANRGHCSTCGQTIKIYRYNINKVLTNLLKAMAASVKDSGVNDVDMSTLDVKYSVRTQVTKLRLHGLIARKRNDEGVQIARHWLITKKGWHYLNGE